MTQVEIQTKIPSLPVQFERYRRETDGREFLRYKIAGNTIDIVRKKGSKLFPRVTIERTATGNRFRIVSKEDLEEVATTGFGTVDATGVRSIDTLDVLGGTVEARHVKKLNLVGAATIHGLVEDAYVLGKSRLVARGIGKVRVEGSIPTPSELRFPFSQTEWTKATAVSEYQRKDADAAVILIQEVARKGKLHLEGRVNAVVGQAGKKSIVVSGDQVTLNGRQANPGTQQRIDGRRRVMEAKLAANPERWIEGRAVLWNRAYRNRIQAPVYISPRALAMYDPNYRPEVRKAKPTAQEEYIPYPAVDAWPQTEPAAPPVVREAEPVVKLDLNTVSETRNLGPQAHLSLVIEQRYKELLGAQKFTSDDVFTATFLSRIATALDPKLQEVLRTRIAAGFQPDAKPWDQIERVVRDDILRFIAQRSDRSTVDAEIRRDLAELLHGVGAAAGNMALQDKIELGRQVLLKLQKRQSSR